MFQANKIFTEFVYRCNMIDEEEVGKWLGNFDSIANLPTRIFPLVSRIDTRPNIPLECLPGLYECAPEFEALSRPLGIRDGRVSLTVQVAAGEYRVQQQK
jgi:hypothetical protein